MSDRKEPTRCGCCKAEVPDPRTWVNLKPLCSDCASVYDEIQGWRAGR